MNTGRIIYLRCKRNVFVQIDDTSAPTYTMLAHYISNIQYLQ
jgi:hypothetical protein